MMPGIGGAMEKREATFLLQQWMRITEWEPKTDSALRQIKAEKQRLTKDGFTTLITVRHHQPNPDNPNGGEHQIALWRQITTDDLQDNLGIELDQRDPYLKFLFDCCETSVIGTTLI